jgi:chromosome segregation ATPase
MEAEDAPGETSAAYEPSPDGKRAKSMVAALQLDTQECLDRLDDLDARLGVDRRKVHEEYINSVRASVTTYVKRVEANPSVSADAGRGLSDLDARIAAAKAEILARQETEVEAKRRHEEMVRSVKRVDEILESLDALATAAGDDPVRTDDAAETFEALEAYELLDDLQARPTAAGPVTESFEANEKREETAEARRRARLEKVGEEKKKKNPLAGSGVAPGLTPRLGTVPLEQYVDSKGGMRDFQGYPGEEASE